MTDHVKGKTIIVTGAAGGFGTLLSEKASARGANLVCADLDEAEVAALADRLPGDALGMAADVTDAAAMKALAAAAVDRFGAVDVMVNNAGTMPLAYLSDHEAALEKWHRCIDVNFKGVVNGTVAVYDQMVVQGRGHIVNLSSIYGNHPVIGSAVYGATKAAVNYFSDSVRADARGVIKVTIVKPTGVPNTGLGAGIVNAEAPTGIVGQNATDYFQMFGQLEEGTLPPEMTDPDRIENAILDPAHIADAILHAIDQPWGVSVGDITIRASGDHYIM